jgi:hypothetical protein
LSTAPSISLLLLTFALSLDFWNNCMLYFRVINHLLSSDKSSTKYSKTFALSFHKEIILLDFVFTN